MIFTFLHFSINCRNLASWKLALRMHAPHGPQVEQHFDRWYYSRAMWKSLMLPVFLYIYWYPECLVSARFQRNPAEQSVERCRLPAGDFSGLHQPRLLNLTLINSQWRSEIRMFGWMYSILRSARWISTEWIHFNGIDISLGGNLVFSIAENNVNVLVKIEIEFLITIS